MNLKKLMVLTASFSMAMSITACGSNNNNGEMQQQPMLLRITQQQQTTLARTAGMLRQQMRLCLKTAHLW